MPTPLTVSDAVPALPVFSQGMITDTKAHKLVYLSGNIGCEKTETGLKVVEGGVKAQTVS